MRSASIAVLCAAMAATAAGQTATAPATAPATSTAPSTATAPATQPERFKTKVSGRDVSIDIPEADLRLAFTMPDLWTLHEGTATSPPFVHRGLTAGEAKVLWSFSIRPVEGPGTPADIIQRLVTKYTIRLDHFAIRDQGSGDLSNGRKYAYMLYTCGGLAVEDQKYIRETLMVLDEKRLLSIVEVSATGEWGTARRELQGITKSLKIVKVTKP